MTIHNTQLRRQMIEDARAQATSLGHRLTPFHELEAQQPNSLFLSAPEHGLLAVCQECGHEVELPTGYGDALCLPCEPDALGAAQGQATLLSQVPALLYPRLAEAAQALPEAVALYFDPGQFDSLALCLLSNDGIWRLQWSPRLDPDSPVTDDNPQSAAGRVELHRQVAQRSIRPVRYIGPLLNPNISLAPKRQRVLPLKPGEEGLAHREEPVIERGGNARWRFRRLGGTRGYVVPERDLDFQVEHEVRTLDIDEMLLALAPPQEGQRGRRPLFVHEPGPFAALPT